MDKTSRPLWRLLTLTDTENSIELTCAECLALLEYDADRLEAGASLDRIRPSIVHHLSLCSACQAHLDRWLTTLEERSNA